MLLQKRGNKSRKCFIRRKNKFLRIEKTISFKKMDNFIGFFINGNWNKFLEYKLRFQ